MLCGVGAACGFIEGSEEAWKRAGVPSVMLCDTHSRSHDRDPLLPREGGVCEPGLRGTHCRDSLLPRAQEGT